MTEEAKTFEVDFADVLKMTSCPKCSLAANTGLHRFCQHKECPVRDATNAARMKALADEGMRHGRELGGALRVWEYEGFDGTWVECRNAEDACMWAEDGRRIREKTASKPTTPEPNPGDLDSPFYVQAGGKLARYPGGRTRREWESEVGTPSYHHAADLPDD
jgi:hypothetical protein